VFAFMLPPALHPLFVFARSAAHPHLHSFPTRRSSDLTHGTLIAVRFNSGAHVDLSPTESAVLALDLIRFADEADPAVFERLEKEDRKSTRLNSSHVKISYAVFCLKKKNDTIITTTSKH